MENFIEKLKTVDKKVLIGGGIGVVVLIVGIIVGIVALVTGGFKDVSGTYTVEVVTEGGKVLEDISVSVYADDSQEDLIAVSKTDEEGKISFESEDAIGAVIVLEDVPRGYVVETSYEIAEKETQIVLSIQLLSEDELDGVTFELGDVFADMSVTAVDGKTYKISELLEEKKAVVLNFWYLNCDSCKAEFPYLQTAYQKYQDDIEVLAVNPVDGDDASIKELQDSLGLTFPMAKIDASWVDIMQLTEYPTTVVIDQYGTIALIHKGAVTEEGVFEKIFQYFSAEEYKQTALNSIDEIAVASEGDGSKENPYVMTGTHFIATVEAGGVVYYEMYRVDGMILTIKDEDAYVIYEGEEYKPEEGVVTVILSTPDTYTSTVFAIGNSSDEEKSFNVSLTYPEGTYSNPYPFELGEFTAKVEAGNDQGVYYKYVAEEAGTLTVTLLEATAGIAYDYSLYNLNTYAMRNMSVDGVADANGNMTVSIVMNAGDEMQFTVGTLPDENNEYPAGEFKFSSVFVPGEGVITDASQMIDYTVTVKDSRGNAIAGVTVTLSGDGIDNTNITTDKSGVAKANLPAITYKAVVSAPDGYQIDSTEYNLTPDKPSVTVTLKPKSNATKTYTVKVVNESGTALSGVLVTVGDTYGITDASGTVSFTLVEDNYTATAEGSSGYTSASKAFGSATSITITLKKGTSSSSSNDKAYIVKVVDYAGNPLKDAAVSFVSGGSTVKTVVVESNGEAKASIPAATYNIQIKFPSGKDYGFDKSTATVTASSTTTTVVAAPKINSSSKTTFYNGEKSAYNITSGAVYAGIQANANNYFIFTPSTSGKYRIKTTNASVKVAHVGSEFYINENPTYSGNVFTTDITDGMIGASFVISVTGASECVLIVERYGSVGATIQPTTYAGSGSVPSSYATPNSVTYVDVTGSGISLVKGSDGYYHKDSASGPIVYIDLSNDSTIDMTNLVDNTSFLRYFFTSSGSIQKIEDYTTLMIKYTTQAAKTNGFVPLTDDMIYMIQNGGQHRGWWDKSVEGGFYLFEGKNINKDIAWMFLLCY